MATMSSSHSMLSPGTVAVRHAFIVDRSPLRRRERSSVMPHSGHVAAHVATISSCIGQTYGVGVGISDSLGPASSRTSGRSPANDAATSGCIGHSWYAVSVVGLGSVVAVEKRHLGPEREDLVGRTFEVPLDLLASGGELWIGAQRVERRGSVAAAMPPYRNGAEVVHVIRGAVFERARRPASRTARPALHVLTVRAGRCRRTPRVRSDHCRHRRASCERR